MGAQISSDDHGNLLEGRKQGQTLFDYTWDARNQLVGLTKNGVSASFAYHGLGRRISKTVNGATTEFVYDGFLCTICLPRLPTILFVSAAPLPASKQIH
jgi:YD repeat-containing protein